MADILLKGGRVIDPANNLDRVCDVQIIGGKINKIGNVSDQLAVGQVIDCHNKIVCPGLIDMHVHARIPGQEHKETFGSLSFAAIIGGFTSVVCMANTDPAIDTVGSLQANLMSIERLNFINIFQIAAVTKKRQGKELTDMRSLAQKGAVAFSDDGDGIWNPLLLFKALSLSGLLNKKILFHCQDRRFDAYDERSEVHDVSLILKVSEICDLPVHLQHISCAASVKLIREAKDRHVPVTCETAPHYISLISSSFRKIGANAKMNPPLRKESDRQAVIQGLIDGTIDVLATDHAPHSPKEKMQAVAKAPFGIIGLETAVPVIFSALVNHLSVPEIIRKLTINPAKILGLQGFGDLKSGAIANIAVIDPRLRKKVEADKFQSLSRNCPWDGKRLQGWPIMTICKGHILMKDGKLIV